jgi:hypothetical protein
VPPPELLLWVFGLVGDEMNALDPCVQKRKDPNPAYSARLSAVRFRAETVGGKPAGRYGGKRTRARGLWHLGHRVIRTVLSHTVTVWAAVAHGLMAETIAVVGWQASAR